MYLFCLLSVVLSNIFPFPRQRYGNRPVSTCAKNMLYALLEYGLRILPITFRCTRCSSKYNMGGGVLILYVRYFSAPLTTVQSHGHLSQIPHDVRVLCACIGLRSRGKFSPSTRLAKHRALCSSCRQGTVTFSHSPSKGIPPTIYSPQTLLL